MTQIITAIALLCQVTGSHGNQWGVATYPNVKVVQIRCQQTLLKCVRDAKGNKHDALEDCILKGGY